MHLLTAVFKDLGCINENGLAIGDGVLPYVSKVLSVIVKKLPNAQRLIKNVDQLID
jgi:hypothetical protein